MTLLDSLLQIGSYIRNRRNSVDVILYISSFEEKKTIEKLPLCNCQTMAWLHRCVAGVCDAGLELVPNDDRLPFPLLFHLDRKRTLLPKIIQFSDYELKCWIIKFVPSATGWLSMKKNGFSFSPVLVGWGKRISRVSCLKLAIVQPITMMVVESIFTGQDYHWWKWYTYSPACNDNPHTHTRAFWITIQRPPHLLFSAFNHNFSWLSKWKAKFLFLLFVPNKSPATVPGHKPLIKPLKTNYLF